MEESKLGTRPSMTLQSREGTMVICGIAAFLFWMSLFVYVPTLPIYVESKSPNLATVGLVLSMYGLLQMLLRFPLGILSDWVGRQKALILMGFAAAGVGAWMLGVSRGAGGMLVGRAITGAAASCWGLVIVLFNRLHPRSETVRATSLLWMVGAVGRSLASAITGPLNDAGGYSLPFTVAAGLAFVGLLVLLPIRDMAQSRRTPSFRGVFSLAVRRPVILPSLLNLIAQYVIWSSSFGFVPILAERLGADAVAQGLLSTAFLVGSVGGSLLATVFVRRVKTRLLVWAAFGILILSTLGASLAEAVSLLFLVQVGAGLSNGVTDPVLIGLSIRGADSSEQTTAAGLHQSVYALGLFVGPAVSGALADVTGIRNTLMITAVIALVFGAVGTRMLSDGRADGD